MAKFHFLKPIKKKFQFQFRTSRKKVNHTNKCLGFIAFFVEWTTLRFQPLYKGGNGFFHAFEWIHTIYLQNLSKTILRSGNSIIYIIDIAVTLMPYDAFQTVFEPFIAKYYFHFVSNFFETIFFPFLFQSTSVSGTTAFLFFSKQIGRDNRMVFILCVSLLNTCTMVNAALNRKWIILLFYFENK